MMDEKFLFDDLRFASRPSKDHGNQNVPIIRTPSGKPMKMIGLDVDAIGIYTHYYRGRTRPHLERSCEACEAAMPMRWHGYLSVLGVKSNSVAVFEFTAACVRVLDEYLRLHRSLRGAMITAYRANTRENGRVCLSLTPSGRPDVELPRPIRLREYLLRLWDIGGTIPLADVQAPPPEQDAFDQFRTGTDD